MCTGQGLGKTESGIAKPIKVGIKRDHAGVSSTVNCTQQFSGEAELREWG